MFSQSSGGDVTLAVVSTLIHTKRPTPKSKITEHMDKCWERASIISVRRDTGKSGEITDFQQICESGSTWTKAMYLRCTQIFQKAFLKASH